MPRMTERQRLAHIRRIISRWGGAQPITLNELADQTGLSPLLLEKICQAHHLRVRLHAGEVRDALGDDYAGAIASFREWCDRTQRDYLTALPAALRRFIITTR